MPCPKKFDCHATLVLAAASFMSVLAQDSTLATTSTASSRLSTVASGTSTTTNDVPLSIWGVAESLLSEYYPSSTITQIASLSWPATVIIDGETYSVHPGSTTVLPTRSEASSATRPDATPALKSSLETAATTSVSKSLQAEKTVSPTADPQNQTSGNPSGGLNSDGKLAIVIGVILGAIAFAIIGVIAFCLRRRKMKTGSYFKGRSTPSAIGSDVEPWHLSDDPEVTMASYAPSHGYPTDTVYHSGFDGHQHLLPPPVAMHPALVRNQSGQEADERNPFITPKERAGYGVRRKPLPSGTMSAVGASIPCNDNGVRRKPVRTAALSGATLQHGYGALGMTNVDFIAQDPTMPYDGATANEQHREYRPPTPLLHMMMRSGPAYQPHNHSNPFSSEEYEEAEDLVSPIIPAKNPERRHSPLVHYPSWDEVSEFDFTGDGPERSIGRQGSYDEGDDDGWHPVRGYTYGRNELA